MPNWVFDENSSPAGFSWTSCKFLKHLFFKVTLGKGLIKRRSGFVIITPCGTILDHLKVLI